MTTNEFRALQKRIGMTNEELAKWLGVSRSTVQKIRAGDVAVPGPIARAMQLRAAAGAMLQAVNPSSGVRRSPTYDEIEGLRDAM